MSTAQDAPARGSGRLSDIKKMFGGGQSTLRQFGIVGSLIVIILLFQVLTNGLTLSPGT